MNIAEAIRIALQSLWANKLRSVLTLLGVVIGVAAITSSALASRACSSRSSGKQSASSQRPSYVTSGRPNRSGPVNAAAAVSSLPTANTDVPPPDFWAAAK